MKLVNPRGRIVDVRIEEVEKLLSKGWLRSPDQTHEYNPVYDRNGIVYDKVKSTSLNEVTSQSGDYLDIVVI